MLGSRNRLDNERSINILFGTEDSLVIMHDFYTDACVEAGLSK